MFLRKKISKPRLEDVEAGSTILSNVLDVTEKLSAAFGIPFWALIVILATIGIIIGLGIFSIKKCCCNRQSLSRVSDPEAQVQEYPLTAKN